MVSRNKQYIFIHDKLKYLQAQISKASLDICVELNKMENKNIFHSLDSI